MCGGAKASLHGATEPPTPPTNPLERWLAPLTEHARKKGYNQLPEKDALRALVNENIRLQVANIVNTGTIKLAWGRAEQGKSTYPVLDIQRIINRLI